MRRERPSDLQRIAEICGLKRMVAEAETNRAASRLRRKEDECSAAGRRRQDAEDGWQSALASRGFDIARVTAWSRSLATEDKATRQLDIEVAHATRERDDRTTAWRMATNRSDAVSEQLRDAWKHCILHRDEVALNDAAELTHRSDR